MLAFKLLLALALLGVACAFMGRLPSTSTRGRGCVSASLEDLERKALSRNMGVQAKTAAPEKQQKGFSLFGGSSASAPAPAKVSVKASAPPAAKTMVASSSKTVKVSKEVAKAVAPATVLTKVKPVAAVQVPSAPVVPVPSGADLGTAGVVGGALLATVAGASAVTNALTGRAKAIAAAEQKKAIEAAARAEFLRQQRARKPLAPGPADGVRLAISAAAIVASAGIFGVAVLAPQAPEAPAPVTKDIKKAAPAPPAPKAAAPAPAPKVEAPKPAPVAEAPKPAPLAEAPKPVPVAEAPKAAAPAPVVEAPKPAPEAPKVEAPKAEAPKPVEAAKAKVEVAKPAPAPEAPSSVAGDAPTARALPADNAIDPEFLKSLKGSKKGKK